jgi:hypothetical protein
MNVNVNIALVPRNSTGFDLNMWLGGVDGHMRHAFIGYTEKEDNEYVKKFAPHIFVAYEDLKEIDRDWYKEENYHIDYFEKIKTWMDNNSEELKKYL